MHLSDDVLARTRVDRKIEHHPFVARRGIRVLSGKIGRRAGHVIDAFIMDSGRTRRSRLGDRHHRRQHFVLDLDQAKRLARNVFVLGDDCGDAVADVAQLLAEHPAIERRGFRRRLPGRRIDDVRAVAVRNHQQHARQPFGAADIEAPDQRMRIRRTQHLDDRRACRDIVLDEARLGLQGLGGIEFRIGLADMHKVVAKFRNRRRRSGRVLQPPLRKLDRFEYLLVATVAVVQPGQRILDVLPRRRRMAFKQIGNDQRQRRIVIARLDDAGIDHRLLHEAQLIPRAQRLGGLDHGAVELRGDQQRGIDDAAIDADRIRTRKTETVVAVAHRVETQAEQQRLDVFPGRAIDFARFSVQQKPDRHFVAPSSSDISSASRSATTTPAM